MKKKTQRLVDRLTELLAVELLEYHDMNWLAGSPKIRNEKKRNLINLMLGIVREIGQEIK